MSDSHSAIYRLGFAPREPDTYENWRRENEASRKRCLDIVAQVDQQNRNKFMNRVPSSVSSPNLGPSPRKRAKTEDSSHFYGTLNTVNVSKETHEALRANPFQPQAESSRLDSSSCASSLAPSLVIGPSILQGAVVAHVKCSETVPATVESASIIPSPHMPVTHPSLREQTIRFEIEPSEYSISGDVNGGTLHLSAFVPQAQSTQPDLGMGEMGKETCATPNSIAGDPATSNSSSRIARNEVSRKRCLDIVAQVGRQNREKFMNCGSNSVSPNLGPLPRKRAKTEDSTVSSGVVDVSHEATRGDFLQLQAELSRLGSSSCAAPSLGTGPSMPQGVRVAHIESLQTALATVFSAPILSSRHLPIRREQTVRFDVQPSGDSVSEYSNGGTLQLSAFAPQAQSTQVIERDISAKYDFADPSFAGDQSSVIGTFGTASFAPQAQSTQADPPHHGSTSVGDLSSVIGTFGGAIPSSSVIGTFSSTGRPFIPQAQSTQRLEDISMFTSTDESTVDVARPKASPSKPKRPISKTVPLPLPPPMALVPRDEANITQLLAGPSRAISAQPSIQAPVKKRKTHGPSAADCSNITSPGNSDVEMDEPVDVKGKKTAPLVKKNSAPVLTRKLTSSSTGDKIKANAAATKKDKSERLMKPKPMTKAEQKRLEKEEEAKDKATTPKQYAERLNAKVVDGTFAVYRDPAKRNLEGLVVVMAHTETDLSAPGTRICMRTLVQRGATLLSTFDPLRVTYVISTAEVNHPSQVVKSLGLKSIKDIPKHILTLNWLWIKDFKDPKNPPPTFMRKYATLASRIPAPPSAVVPSPSASKLSKRQTLVDLTEEVDQSVSGIQEVSSRPGSPSKYIPDKGDTLAEFYDQARMMRDEGFETDASECMDVDDDLERDNETEDEAEDDSGDDRPRSSSTPAAPVPPRGKRRWACDARPEGEGDKPCPNQDVIKMLSELQGIHKSKTSTGDHWRSYSYNRSIGALRRYPSRIKNLGEAMKIPGVGSRTAKKIMEIIKTGKLERLNSENTEEVKTTRLFTQIYNVGPTIAANFYSAGCRTLEDVKQQRYGIDLTPAMKIGLRFHEDLQDRMSREEAKEIFDKIKPLLLRLDSKLFIEIMGSYRRGKNDCGDIDILVTRPTDDGRTHAGILAKAISVLGRAGILTEDLTLPSGDDLEGVYHGLCALTLTGTRRRIDILTVPYRSRGAALLYYTGDDIFNRSMRLKAGRMGYSLNQRGLYAGVVRDPTNRMKKLHNGTIIASETEEQIFEILEVEWQAPHQRARG